MTALSPAIRLEGNCSNFSAHLGLEVLEYSQARTIIALQIRPEHLNHAGNLHGGVIASIADTAMSLCGTWHADPDQRRLAVTLSLNLNYMAPAPAGSRVRMVARVRGGGKKIFMAACDLLNAEDELLASADGVFKRNQLRLEIE
ncbi:MULTISPECIES: PaaI family thioesterase [Pseudomonas]|uniref:PaaI family thioesterase n=1 Tax=Pseudomonas TaxID=286 RepID=UPI001C8BEFB3|nr:PaaI family thioesterase [Pseudomonas baetica]MBX9410295.1 PaaI family thioesterase [Pseudomonas baetica]